MFTPIRRLALGAFLAAALLVQLTGFPPEEAAGPCLVVKHDGGRSPDRKSGLVLAVWDDGAMLFAAGDDSPGERLLVGQAPEEEVKAMLQGIAATGFFLEKREHYAVPDAASTTIMVRNGKEKALHTWHEYLLPGFGGDINTDPAYRNFVKMWKKSRGAIEALAPVSVARLEEKARNGAFRGYDIASWWNTAWMKETAWRP